MKKRVNSCEEWRSAVGHESDYEVSDCGGVRSWLHTGGSRRTTPKILRPYRTGVRRAQYLTVSIVCKQHKVHVLVAAAFLGPRPDGLSINHKDGQRENNRVDNLEYTTASENTAHAYRLGLIAPRRGSANARAVLTEADVLGIRARTTRGVDEARRFGVTPTLICNIRKRKVWKHV